MVTYAFEIENLIQTGRICPEDTNKLSEWIKVQDLPQINEKQMCLFLLACENNIDNTKKCIISYYCERKNAPELFDNRNTERKDIIAQLKTLEFCIIPERTHDNHCIIINRLADSNACNYNMDAAMKILLMTFDSLLYEKPPNGIILLFDMNLMKLSHITKTKLGTIRKILRYIQDGMPLCLREIHVLNVVWFFNKIFAVIKPLMYRELINKLHIHPVGLDMNEFYQSFIPKTHLPSDYGGELESVKEMHKETIQALTDLNAHFAEEENQRKTFYNKEN